MTTTAPRPGFLERISDRLNPVLVKEVRQSLRGAYFRRTFFLTLSATVTLGLIVLLVGVRDDDGRLGEYFFTVIYACLCGAVLVLVPLSAYFSVGAEKEEKTYDLLVLSNIRPRQIVLGKLGSAVMLDLLFLSAALPFLVCSFLLPGADLLAMLYLVAAAMVLSVALALSAISISTYTSVKFVRVMILAAIFGGLAMITLGMSAMCAELMRRPGQLRDDDFLYGNLFLGVAILISSAYSLAVAAANLSHAEENRSTPMRLVSLIAIALVPLLTGLMIWLEGYDDEGIMAVTCVALVALAAPAVFFVTEPERLTRRTALDVPRSGLLAAGSAFLLPGGGRGMLFFLLQSGLLLGFGYLLFFAVRWFDPSADLEGGAAAFLLAAYLVIYLGLPSALFSGGSGGKGRGAARILILTIPAVMMILPSLIGLMVDSDIDFDHVGNPVYVISQAYDADRGRLPLAAVTVLLGALLVIALNAPRMLRGVHEVRQVRAEMRRARVESDA